MSNKPKKWEIWDAIVKFEDRPTISKIRPVLVVNPDLIYILSFKITSHDPREEFPYEYPIHKWKECGLDRPSTIRLSKKLELSESDLTAKRGKLQTLDIFGIQEMIRKRK